MSTNQDCQLRLNDLVRWIIDEMNESFYIPANVIKVHQPLNNEEFHELFDQYIDIECDDPINNIVTLSNNDAKSRVDVRITPYYLNDIYKMVDLKIRYIICDDGFTLFDHDDIQNVINYWGL